jgi:tetratricopeptide (TPR) repeat protein
MENLRDKAIEFMERQQYDRALPFLLDLIKDNSNDAWLYYMAGQCFRFINDISNAIKFLAKATEIEAEEYEFWHALGISYQLGGDYVKAVESFHEALFLNENGVSTYNSIGLTYKKLSEYNKAAEWYKKGIEINEKIVRFKVDTNPAIREKYKELYATEKKTMVFPLIEYIEELKKDSIQTILYNNLGVVLMEMGELEEAQSMFETSISFIPKNYAYFEPYENLLQLKDIVIEKFKTCDNLER